MQTYLVITDGSAEIRIPINARVEAPVVAAVPTIAPVPTKAPETVQAPTQHRVVREYPPGTRERAVRLVLGGARPIDVRDALGVAQSTLDNWMWRERKLAA